MSGNQESTWQFWQYIQSTCLLLCPTKLGAVSQPARAWSIDMTMLYMDMSMLYMDMTMLYMDMTMLYMDMSMLYMDMTMLSICFIWSKSTWNQVCTHLPIWNIAASEAPLKITWIMQSTKKKHNRLLMLVKHHLYSRSKFFQLQS